MTPIDARAWAAWVVFAFTIPIVSCDWSRPTRKTELWHVGDVHHIEYQTDLTWYTIILWQESLAGGWAAPGPIIYQTDSGPADVLDWTVQLYDFDLGFSNKFFFWLKEGGPENSTGPVKGRTMSSPYFNITDEPSPTTTTSSSSSSSSSTESSSSTLSTDVSTSLSSTATRSAPDQGEATASGTALGEGTEGTNGGAEGSGGGGGEGEGEGGEGEGEGGGGEEGGGSLPVAAQAGIGVGVSVVGATVIICGILWFRYLKKQQQILLDLHRAYTEPPPSDAAGTEAGKSQASHIVQYYPAYELGYDPRPPPAELGCPPAELGLSSARPQLEGRESPVKPGGWVR